MYEKLFSPIKIRGMELKNRVILPAMGTRMSDHKMVTDKLIHYHVARAKGGNGLNIVEVASVEPLSSPKQFVSIAEDQFIPGLRRLTDAVHEAGAKIGIQLWQGSIAVMFDPAAVMYVASDMPVSAEMTLPGISVEQIHYIADCFGKAAARAAAAGFDCVEFHCAHNYLPHSFLSGGINHRTDEYGGSLENRARFPLEAIRAIRAAIPEDMPILMRIDAHDDCLENGLTIEEVIQFCKWAGEAGVDVLDVSRGNIITPALKYEVPSIDIPCGFNIDNAARIRRETGMLTIGVGRINTPELAEQILEEDKVDMVVIGRGQLADAAFCNKAREGRRCDIVSCVGCDQGCYDGFSNLDMPHITCLRNPEVGLEEEMAPRPCETPLNVLIAGGGIGGMQAALVLKKRGHIPVLYESSDHLGGQFLLAGEAPRKQEMKAAMFEMASQVRRAEIEVHLNTPVTPELIAAQKPHTVICAIGSEPIQLRIPGADGANVVDSHEVLSGKAAVSGKVVVIGGGLVGMEAAEYLAERGCQVTVLEMLPEVCADIGPVRKICVMEEIARRQIQTVTGITVIRMEAGAVIGKKEEKEERYDCDYAVVAVGARSRDASALEAACRANGIAFVKVGDALRARRALNATFEAQEAAVKFDRPEYHNTVLAPPKTVFLTGGTGKMGMETVKQLLARKPKFIVRMLARPSQKNKDLVKKIADPYLEVVWGDMKDYETILNCVTGADYVLHIGAMVSPAADKYPEETLRTNIGSTLNIIRAIKAQPNPDAIKFAYVGTVAETGDRPVPVNWGRCGDPINPSAHDYYAMSKVFSELSVFDSGLKHWVSIRQTGQYPPDQGAGEEPIQHHQNPNNVLEWSTAIESGICMANLCENWVPETFWRKCYNLSSGKGWRFAHWELMNFSFGPMGIQYKDVFDVTKCALYNFHGHYYTDSDLLDDMLHFRVIPPEAYRAGVTAELEAMMKNPMIAARMPNTASQKEKLERISHKEMGTAWMLEENKQDWIRAFFGSKEKQQQIKSVEEGYEFFHPSEENPVYLDHGYDESRPLAELTVEEIQKAAAFRGCKLLDETIPDIYTPVRFVCSEGHVYEMSINAMLQGGHWCPECQKQAWHYADMARKSPFYAQVWTPVHGEGDDYVIPMRYSAFAIWKELKEKLGLS